VRQGRTPSRSGGRHGRRWRILAAPGREGTCWRRRSGGRTPRALLAGAAGRDGPPRARIQDWIRHGRAHVTARCASGRAAPARRGAPDPAAEPPARNWHRIRGRGRGLATNTWWSSPSRGLHVHSAPAVPRNPGPPSGPPFPGPGGQGRASPGHRAPPGQGHLRPYVAARTEAARLAFAPASTDGWSQRPIWPWSTACPRPLWTHRPAHRPRSRGQVRDGVAVKGGREAKSRYRTVWSDPAAGPRWSRVDIETGRITPDPVCTWAAIGHPSSGRGLWSGPGRGVPPRGRARRRLCRRQMLHAWRLSFPHPEPGPLAFERRLRRISGALPLLLSGAPSGWPRWRSVQRKIRASGAFRRGRPSGLSADAAVAALYALAATASRCHEAIRGQLPPSGRRGRQGRCARGHDRIEAFRRELMDMIHPLVRQALSIFFRENARARWCSPRSRSVESGWHQPVFSTSYWPGPGTRPPGMRSWPPGRAVTGDGGPHGGLAVAEDRNCACAPEWSTTGGTRRPWRPGPGRSSPGLRDMRREAAWRLGGKWPGGLTPGPA
jgi:23S rRNA pseudouridine1911/1915/1917 synthase